MGQAQLNPTGEGENCDGYIVRRKDQREWIAKAKSGDEAARICVAAASNYMKAIPDQPSTCGCCDTPFLLGYIPQAFLVLIPTRRDPKKSKAYTRAVCWECSKHDDRWLVEHGVRRVGLAPAAGAPRQ